MDNSDNTANTVRQIEILKQFVTENRYQRMLRIVEERTQYMSIVLENIYQPHNTSAVLRSCDCFGIQDVHVIENENKYSLNKDIALGSSNWLNIIRYNKNENNTAECLNSLKSKGYRLVATLPSPTATSIFDFDVSAGKFALLMGTELTGLSDIACKMADENIYLPMVGFTESLNISVTAATFMFYLSQKIKKLDVAWQLDDITKNKVLLNWLINSVKSGNEILNRFDGEGCLV